MKWEGAAAVCINEQRKVLMVLQGKPEETKSWSVPSGGMEEGETIEQCCAREVWEETGYHVAVGKRLLEKKGTAFGTAYAVQYFECEIIGGTPTIQDPDGLIHEIAWKSSEELQILPLSFPEDLAFLLSMLEARHVDR
ncbi:DNA mismatch repair protein MutT [Paenibacillus contaminans]|uniref:DNA mismatch repair protein MutT n=2 Tax=Paenibacillus contaminans TaxID=450362 RepID=A0A329MLK0_9BACL|nr:DNA mismatch repair protein MutT [Paenibacillus contaminans]